MKSDNSKPQCYIVQMQFDSYLDGELGESQQESFLHHLKACAACAEEFRYARAIQDGMLDLPLLDCADQVIVPANELTGQVSAQGGDDLQKPATVLAELARWFGAAPDPLRLSWHRSLRFAIPVLLIAIVGLIFLPGMELKLRDADQAAPVAAVQVESIDPLPAEYSAQELAQALADLSLAIEYLNQVSERTENMIGGRFLMRPLQDRLGASFERVRNNVQQNVGGEEI